MFFSWFTDTLKKGFQQRSLQLDDIPPLPSYLTSYQCKARLEQANQGHIQQDDERNWLNMTGEGPFRKKHNKTKNAAAEEQEELVINASSWPLLFAIVRCHYASLMKITLLKALGCGFSFLGPLVLGEMVKYLEHGIRSDNIDYGVMLIIALGSISLCSAIINSNSNARSVQLKMELVAAMTQVVFARALSLPASAWNDLNFNEAQINNFAQVDIDRIASCLQNINDLWLLPAQIIIAFALLYLQIKIAFVAGVVVILLMIPLNSYIAKAIGSASEDVMKNKDARVKIITEALKNMASVKMCGLEDVVTTTAQRFRVEEVKHLAKRKYLDSLCVFLWAATPILVPFATFTTAVLIADHKDLTSAKIITTIALLNMLIFPMNAFPWVINGLMEARVSIRRVSKLLNSSDNVKLVAPDFISFVKKQLITPASTVHNKHNIKQALFSPAKITSTVETDDAKEIVLLKSNYQYTWKHTSNSLETFYSKESSMHKTISSFRVTLQKDLFGKRGQLWIVVGATGSGKSSLLLSILQELCNEERPEEVEDRATSVDLLVSVYRPNSPPRTIEEENKSVFCNVDGGLSYCSQTPTIFSGNVRSNIIMGTKFNESRYNRVVAGCALLHDMQVS